MLTDNIKRLTLVQHVDQWASQGIVLHSVRVRCMTLFVFERMSIHHPYNMPYWSVTQFQTSGNKIVPPNLKTPVVIGVLVSADRLMAGMKGLSASLLCCTVQEGEQ